MPTLFLIRHGETEWNNTGQIMGEQPIPLTPVGQDQAQRLSTVLLGSSVTAIYSSPVYRAKQTAETLALSMQLPVVEDRGLTEINVGEWVGRFWTELAEDLTRRHYYSNPKDARPPGGETLGEVQTRSVAVAERAMKTHPDAPSADARIVLVTHADVVRTIIGHYVQWDLNTIRQVRIDHASLTALHIQDSLTTLMFLNYTPEPLRDMKQEQCRI